MTTAIPMAAAARVTPTWLALREPADAGARSVRLVEQARAALPVSEPLVVHDLGTGTGSMVRWLAPLLPGPQHWVLHDRDADLLTVAATDLPVTAADGTAVTAEARCSDVTRLRPDELVGASLVTASALLDVLTHDELTRLVAACAARPTLLTLSVVGRVTLTPVHPLDPRVEAAFNAHQRRDVGDGRRLGPDAVGVAATLFHHHGCAVNTDDSPWRLGPDRARLTTEWLAGWATAAAEAEPGLPLDDYLPGRLENAAAGRLDVTVGHRDLLALPPCPEAP